MTKPTFTNRKLRISVKTSVHRYSFLTRLTKLRVLRRIEKTSPWVRYTSGPEAWQRIMPLYLQCARQMVRQRELSGLLWGTFLMRKRPNKRRLTGFLGSGAPTNRAMSRYEIGRARV